MPLVKLTAPRIAALLVVGSLASGAFAMGRLNDWNVVVTVKEGDYRQAKSILRAYGEVSGTEFYNVLVMRVDAIGPFLEELMKDREREPLKYSFLGHLSPLTAGFTFQSVEEFERKAAAVTAELAPALAGKRFHIRIHRRGFKGRLSSPEEERFLDRVVHERLTGRGELASVDFGDPDAIILLETVGQRAGVSLWSRQDRLRYDFLPLS